EPRPGAKTPGSGRKFCRCFCANISWPGSSDGSVGTNRSSPSRLRRLAGIEGQGVGPGLEISLLAHARNLCSLASSPTVHSCASLSAAKNLAVCDPALRSEGLVADRHRYPRGSLRVPRGISRGDRERVRPVGLSVGIPREAVLRRAAGSICPTERRLGRDLCADGLTIKLELYPGHLLIIHRCRLQ